MEIDKCSIHSTDKIYLNCLKSECRHTLQCWRCHYEQKKHENIFIDQMMTLNRMENKSMFEYLVDETIKESQDHDEFKQKLKDKIVKILGEKRQNVQVLNQMIVNETESMMYRWMNKLNSQMIMKEYHQINEVRDNVIDEIKIFYQNIQSQLANLKVQHRNFKEMVLKQHDEVNEEIKKKHLIMFIESSEKKYQRMVDLVKKQQNQVNEWIFENENKVKEFVQEQQIKKEEQIKKDPTQTNIVINKNNLKDVQELKKCKNKVHIKNLSKLDDCKKEIKKYEKDKKQYQVWIDFTNLSSLDQQIKLIKMISEFNADNKVGVIFIELKNDKDWNEQLIMTMIKRYSNIYSIGIDDYSKTVNERTHSMIKQLIEYSTLRGFGLLLKGDLYFNKQGLKLMQEYNQLLQQKEHLEYLVYFYNTIDEHGESRYQVQQLIETVSKL